MRADALTFTGPNQMSYQRVDYPEPKADDVLMRVTHGLVSTHRNENNCGSRACAGAGDTEGVIEAIKVCFLPRER